MFFYDNTNRMIDLAYKEFQCECGCELGVEIHRTTDDNHNEKVVYICPRCRKAYIEHCISADVFEIKSFKIP